ncbi:MAG: proline iminopeptidase-family hydrolase [Gemmatimonadaceae bacterium]
MSRIVFVGALPLFVLAACSGKKPAATDSVTATAKDTSRGSLLPGEAFLPVDGGKIWYRVVGSGTAMPAVLLHGGPGFGSYFMKPLEQLSNDRPIVRYDQLGGGASDRLTDTTKMTIAHFVAELDSLRSHLGYNKVHLIGHSWGTILALEYYRVHPEHVASLTLASPAFDVPAWEKNARELEKTLPDSSRKAIQVREAEKKYDAPDYQAALTEFYGKYVWRHPDSVNLDSTFKTVSEPVYNYMEGPSEFTITGTLKTYDATPFLKNVKVPVLYTVGEFDEANPAIVKRFASMTPGSRYFVIPGSGHISEWDNPEAMNKMIRDFLKDVDGRH